MSLVGAPDPSPDPGPPPHLYHFRISHFNEKVRWALDHKRWPHRRTALVPGFHAPRTFWKSRQTGLPILVLDGRVLVDSTSCVGAGRKMSLRVGYAAGPPPPRPSAGLR